MKKKYSSRLQIGNLVAVVLLTIVTFLCFLSCYVRIGKIQRVVLQNDLRPELNDHMEKIRQGTYDECNYDYIVFTTAGKVLHTQGEFLEVMHGNVNVQEMLSMDQSFLYQHPNKTKEIFAVEEQGVVNRFVLYLIPDHFLHQQQRQAIIIAILPMCIVLILLWAGFLLRMWYENRFLLSPMRKISESADQIIRGNYEIEVRRIFGEEIADNEIGQLTYCFESMRDELKAKQIREEELKKSQQELISCISHDLKTPIATILAYAEGIRDGIATTKEEQMEYVQIVIKKTKLLTDMIQELLEFSNASLNQLEIDRQEVYLQNYFGSVLSELNGYVRNQGIEFLYELPDVNPVLLIDEKRMTEVLYNLVENSMKYRSQSKAVIRILVTWEEERVLVRVQDNGIGIHVDDLPYVFDKFYRGEKSRSSSIPGSGLGLSICRYIIEKHHGEIYCRNRAHGGCEFGFTIG